jgi:Tfp pilus assembly protein PilO
MSGEERTTLAIILAVVVSFGMGYFGLKPVLANYHNQRLLVGARTQEIANLEERKSDLARIQSQLTKYESQINLLSIAVPDGPQYPELLNQIATMAEESQLILSSIQPQQDEVVNTTSVQVNLTVRGSFPNMLSFAERVENNLRPINVISISLLEGGNPDAADQLTATIQMRLVRTSGLATSGSAL